MGSSSDIGNTGGIPGLLQKVFGRTVQGQAQYNQAQQNEQAELRRTITAYRQSGNMGAIANMEDDLIKGGIPPEEIHVAFEDAKTQYGNIQKNVDFINDWAKHTNLPEDTIRAFTLMARQNSPDLNTMLTQVLHAGTQSYIAGVKAASTLQEKQLDLNSREGIAERGEKGKNLRTQYVEAHRDRRADLSRKTNNKALQAALLKDDIDPGKAIRMLTAGKDEKGNELSSADADVMVSSANERAIAESGLDIKKAINKAIFPVTKRTPGKYYGENADPGYAQGLTKAVETMFADAKSRNTFTAAINAFTSHPTQETLNAATKLIKNPEDRAKFSDALATLYNRIAEEQQAADAMQREKNADSGNDTEDTLDSNSNDNADSSP